MSDGMSDIVERLRVEAVHLGNRLDLGEPDPVLLEAAAHIEAQGAELARAHAERDGWMETAAQHLRNEEWMRGLLERIGNLFGEAARTSDDGSVQDSVLLLRVPELVEAQAAEIARLRAALDGLLRRYVGLVNCGDCGFWNPEQEAEVIAARAALASEAPRDAP